MLVQSTVWVVDLCPLESFVWSWWWRVLADATAYLMLFLTVSGIYLWVALKTERRVGLVLMLAGAITFWGLVYAVTA